MQMVDAIVSSPVRRCIQTAEAIRIGSLIDEPIRVVSAFDLPRAADPVAHVRDLAIRGWDTCTQEWLRGIAGPGGLPSAQSVAEEMLDAFSVLARDARSPVIAVTHDINILAIYGYLANAFEVACPYLGGIKVDSLSSRQRTSEHITRPCVLPTSPHLAGQMPDASAHQRQQYLSVPGRRSLPGSEHPVMTYLEGTHSVRCSA